MLSTSLFMVSRLLHSKFKFKIATILEDRLHKSNGLNAWSYVVKDTFLSSKWFDNVSGDPETVALAS